MTTPAPLSPTARTTLGRSRERGSTDRAHLHALLATAPMAHLGVVVDAQPLVLPVAFAADLAGPDPAGTVYVHGSVAARWLGAAAGRTVCLTVTELDGLVLARSTFHHSMNYRSAVVIGMARLVEDQSERRHALNLVVDHLVAGRAATLRPSTRKELAATAVLAIPLLEASVKSRSGDPVDEDADVAAGVWAGIVPVTRVLHPAESAADSPPQVPDDVRRLIADS